MSDTRVDPESFYRERVPAQFNRTLRAQAESARGGDEPARRLYEAMCSVTASIGIRVRSAEGEDEYHLNIEQGVMSPGAAPIRAPFMTLVHDLASFAVLERESGDSVLGFLGAVAGMRDEMKLTSNRIQNLAGLDGSLRFALTGENAFEITAHFGSGAIPEQPTCSLTIDSGAYGELRSGALAPQDAFLSGQIEVEGDMQMAMQIALAALSPE